MAQEGKFFGKDGFIWFQGVVEDRKDPLKLGRSKVRIFGWHTEDKKEQPTENLPWALPVLPIDEGQNVVGPKEGDWVIGFFLDGHEGQQPIVFGKIPGIPEDETTNEKSKIGFHDPTPRSELTRNLQPRPPTLTTPNEEDEEIQVSQGRFGNPERLPGQGTAYGMLKKEIEGPTLNPTNYIYDMDADGDYDQDDADILTNPEQLESVTQRVSRYPLNDRLNEPTSSRLARNENIAQTIVALKKGGITYMDSASFTKDLETLPEGSDVTEDSAKVPVSLAGMQSIEIQKFEEPETPYASQYPYNHVYESESGHVIEIDDTPGAERLHRYHRSGTFEEIHPGGTKVDKTVDEHYNMVVKNFYNHSGEHTNMVADQDFKIKAGGVVVCQSGGTMNFDVGDSINIKVTKDGNIIIGGTARILIEESCALHVKEDLSMYVEGNYTLNVEKDMHTHVEGNNTLIVDGSTKMQTSGIHEIRSVKTSIPEGQVETALFADGANRAFPSSASGKVPEYPVAPEAEIVEDVAEEVEEPEKTSTQAGFILDIPKNGDLWKPISEGDGNCVSLSTIPGQHILYEAIPTGELEEHTIQYMHEDLTVQTWEIVRPKHIRGEVIEASYNTGSLGGREVWRWSKPGGEYPKQCLLATGFTNSLPKDDPRSQGWLLYDSSIRHD